jgi:hypothetical protein
VTRRPAAAVLLAATLLALLPGDAAAEPVSTDRFAELVSAAAEGDAEALMELAAVTSVDGEPVRMDRVLDAGGEDRSARLAELRDSLASPAGADDDSLSERADELTAGDRASGSSAGDGAAPPLGVSTPVALLLAALTVLLAVAASVIASRRALPPGESRDPRPAAGSPRALEREADAAAASGDWAEGIRLRFRAGLLRLGDARVLDLRPSLTSGEVARTVPSQRVPPLVSSFERVAYGGGDGSREEYESARREWPAAVEEAKGR